MADYNLVLNQFAEILRGQNNDPAVPTVEQMRQMFLDGIVGTKEMRSWLAKKDADFESIRDPHVDAQIDSIARQREETMEAWRREAEEKDRLRNQNQDPPN